RLVAMHTAEGEPDAYVVAETELNRIHDDVDLERGLESLKHFHVVDALESVWPSRYATIEATRDLFLAMAAGVAAALWVTRARPAVAAFSPPSQAADRRPKAVGEAASASDQQPSTSSDGGDGPPSPGAGGPSPEALISDASSREP